MQSFCFYLLPLFALFNTLLSSYLVYRVALTSPRWRKAFFETSAEFISQEFSSRDMGQLRKLLESRYDGFIETLKQRIPMAEMVMRGPLETSLKEQVQTEIDKLLPELKSLLLTKPEEIKALVEERFDPFYAKIQRQFRLKIILSLAAISLSFGLIQLLIFLALCR
jgi:hypothetical protein